jgi:hypothetical protein
VESINDGRVIESFLDAYTAQFPGLEVRYDLHPVDFGPKGQRNIRMMVQCD